MTQNLNSISEKIRKIMLKAEGSTHPDEAEAFMAKAQSMMMEHGLSLLDLGRLDSDDPVGTDMDVTTANTSAKWRLLVANALANYYGAKIVTTSVGTMTHVNVVGRESARVTFIMMVEYIYRQVRAQAHVTHKAGLHRNHKVAMVAVGNALALRIWDLVMENRKAENVVGAARGLNALVPVDLIDIEMRASFSHLRKRTSSRPVKTDSAAVATAGRIGLHRQTTAAGASRMIAG